MAPSRRLSTLLLLHNGAFHKRSYTSVVLSNVLPDVSASAACVRTHSLIKGLVGDLNSTKTTAKTPDTFATNAESTHGHNNQVIYATSVPFDKANTKDAVYPGDHPTHHRVRMVHLPLNRSDAFDEFCHGQFSTTTTNGRPDLVLFDRFFMEESHSFRFHQRFPEAALVLDLQDLHSLRWGRQEVVRQWDHHRQRGGGVDDPLACLPAVLGYRPTLDEVEPCKNNKGGITKHHHDQLLRELASIHRSDLTLVCSPFELDLLQNEYQIPSEKLCLASFFVDPVDQPVTVAPTAKSTKWSSAEQEEIPFVFCGGFRHAPNVDAVDLLLHHVWPRIRSQLPSATLHIHGAFCPPTLKAQHHQPDQTGVHMHGYTAVLSDVFGENKQCGERPAILLAPLRFGAGIKGKIIDAWTFGLPVVTTPIGSEGMTSAALNDDNDDKMVCFGGRIASTVDDFVHEALDLATNWDSYRQAQVQGYKALESQFRTDRHWNHVRERLLEVLPTTVENISPQLQSRRRRDFTQAMLWHQSARSTEFFSKWIECKEAKLRTGEKGMTT